MKPRDCTGRIMAPEHSISPHISSDVCKLRRKYGVIHIHVLHVLVRFDFRCLPDGPFRSFPDSERDKVPLNAYQRSLETRQIAAAILLIRPFWVLCYRWFVHLSFSPSGPAMVRTDQKDLNSNKTNKQMQYRKDSNPAFSRSLDVYSRVSNVY